MVIIGEFCFFVNTIFPAIPLQFSVFWHSCTQKEARTALVFPLPYEKPGRFLKKCTKRDPKIYEKHGNFIFFLLINRLILSLSFLPADIGFSPFRLSAKRQQKTAGGWLSHPTAVSFSFMLNTASPPKRPEARQRAGERLLLQSAVGKVVPTAFHINVKSQRRADKTPLQPFTEGLEQFQDHF